MLHELENFASRILNGDDFEVIDHNINRSIHLIFTDGFEVTLSRQRRNGEDVYFFTYGAALPHRIKVEFTHPSETYESCFYPAFHVRTLLCGTLRLCPVLNRTNIANKFIICPGIT